MKFFFLLNNDVSWVKVNSEIVIFIKFACFFLQCTYTGSNFQAQPHVFEEQKLNCLRLKQFHENETMKFYNGQNVTTKCC